MTQNHSLRKGLLVLLVLVASVLVARLLIGANREVAPTSLRNLLNPEGCIKACWRGIRPGITDQQTVQTILEREAIEYVDLPLPAPEMNAVYDFSQGEEVEPSGFVSVSGGIVNQLALSIDVCVSRVVEEYGEPAGVEESDFYFYLFYPDDGIVFSINGGVDMTRASVAYLVEDVVPGFTEVPLTYNWEAFKNEFEGQCDESIVKVR
jgi:hypothetical protein